MDEHLSISEVVERLKPEFPDLTASNLRYWEEQELLSPARSKGGHRLYSTEDLERIRWIKRLQTKRYYPLAMIRHLLKKKERQGTTFLETEPAGEEFLRPLNYDPAFIPLSREELAQRCGLSIGEIRELERSGYLRPARENGDVRFDEDDLRLAELAQEIKKLGLPLCGLKFYYPGLKTLVEAEVDLVARNVFARLPHEQWAAVFHRLKEAAAEVRDCLYQKIFLEVLASHEDLTNQPDHQPDKQRD